MKLKFFTSMLVAACCLASSNAGAQHMEVVTSDRAASQSKLTSKNINWLTSLEDAKALAKQQGRLVFWVHMLGNIDGYT
jgi:uncharacterized protein (UPF0333 family)